MGHPQRPRGAPCRCLFRAPDRPGPRGSWPRGSSGGGQSERLVCGTWFGAQSGQHRRGSWGDWLPPPRHDRETRPQTAHPQPCWSLRPRRLERERAWPLRYSCQGAPATPPARPAPTASLPSVTTVDTAPPNPQGGQWCLRPRGQVAWGLPPGSEGRWPAPLRCPPHSPWPARRSRPARSASSTSTAGPRWASRPRARA